jgi:formylglycine-generating enzyme required for sulfatase activity
MHNENVTGQIKHIRVKPFRISQYPITNLQFQAFLDAPDGYSNEKWWSSRHAKHWWQQHPHHPRPHTMSKTTPRETVSWYSALAFCKWLAHHTGRRLRLPHLAHWQRAVQGQDDRMFPWGNDFDPTRCNTRETGQKVPTPVDCYPQGRSPYDVYDLAGNVWEWCMDYQEEDDVLTGGDRIRKRAVVGGSAVSPLERAQVGEHFYLHPNTVFGSIGFRIVDLSE